MLVQEAHRAVQEENRGIPILAAKTLRDMGRRDESYDQLERTIALNPKHADGYTLRGQFLLFDQLEQLVQRTTPMRNEDKRLVIDSFQRAFELEPLRLSRGGWARTGLPYVRRGCGAAGGAVGEAARRSNGQDLDQPGVRHNRQSVVYQVRHLAASQEGSPLLKMRVLLQRIHGRQPSDGARLPGRCRAVATKRAVTCSSVLPSAS